MSQEASSSNRFAPERRNAKSGVILAGTVMAVLGAGVAWQVARAKPGIGGEEAQTGRATVAGGTEALARVNGEPVTWEIVAREAMDRYGREVLENIINRKLIQQACAERGVSVSQAEVSAEITRISKRFGLDVATWYKMLEAERGLTGLQYQRDVIWPMLALKKLAGTEVKITREMMQRAYADAYGPKARCKMIMLDNLRHAEKVWKEAKQHPEEFERLAQEWSVEPNSKALGGTIPPIRRFTGAHEAVRTAAFKMRTPNEVSSIIEVGLNSYVILKFEGFTEKIIHEVKDVQAQLHAELVEQEVQKMVAETFTSIRESAEILNYVTGESTAKIQKASATGTPGAGAQNAAYPQPTGRTGQPRQPTR